MDISGTRFRGTQRRAHCAVKRAGCARRRARAPRQRRLHPEAVLQRRRGFRGSLRQGFPEDGAILAGGGRSEGSAFPALGRLVARLPRSEAGAGRARVPLGLRAGGPPSAGPRAGPRLRHTRVGCLPSPIKRDFVSSIFLLKLQVATLSFSKHSPLYSTRSQAQLCFDFIQMFFPLPRPVVKSALF